MYDDRGPNDPVRRSSTAEIDGPLIDPDDIRVVNVENQEGEELGLLIRWERACWMWCDEDDVVELSNNL